MSVTYVYQPPHKVRSDSAAYQQDVLHHWQGRGWQFAVSADMSQGLKQEIEALPPDAWKVWRTEKRELIIKVVEIDDAGIEKGVSFQ